MSAKTLQDIMNEMARHPEMLEAPAPVILPEDIEAACYMEVDALLADLHKQQEDARAKRDKLVRENGSEDAMALVAADMLESARSAFETRLIEVRKDRYIRGLAKRLIREKQFEQRQAENREREKREARFYLDQHREIIERMMRDRNEDLNEIIFFIFFVLYNTLQIVKPVNFSRASRPLTGIKKSLAGDFSLASDRKDVSGAASAS